MQVFEHIIKLKHNLPYCFKINSSKEFAVGDVAGSIMDHIASI